MADTANTPADQPDIAATEPGDGAHGNGDSAARRMAGGPSVHDQAQEILEEAFDGIDLDAFEDGDLVRARLQDGVADGLQSYKTLIVGLQDQIAELQDKQAVLMRQAADLDNRKKQADREVEKARKFGIQKFAEQLLPVADNMERALAHKPQNADEDEQLRRTYEGVELTHRTLMAAFRSAGIEPVASEGELLDPNRHEAVQQVEDASVPDNTVLKVFQSGYMIAERLLRPALVVVATGGPRAEVAPTAPDVADMATSEGAHPGGSGEATGEPAVNEADEPSAGQA